MKEQTTGAKPIPAFRRQIINDPNELPDRYSSTPGGTLYSTTPGGTRIIYERNFLMNLKNSPLAKSPPNHMAFIPGVTNIQQTPANDYHCKALEKPQVPYRRSKNHHNNNNAGNKKSTLGGHDQPQFDMDI